jgi:hypothetical protein
VWLFEEIVDPGAFNRIPGLVVKSQVVSKNNRLI